MLEHITQEFTSITEKLWYKYSKSVNITKCSKTWQNEECDRDLANYQIFRRRTDWIKYGKLVRIAKKIFFNNKIQEITLTNKRLWDLMN